MKKFLLILIILLISCSIDKKPLRIAFISSITGELSSLGIETRNSIEIFISEKNRFGGIDGRPLELLVFDDENSKDVSAAAIDSILDMGIEYLITAQTSAYGEQLLEQVKNKSIIVISPTMSSTQFSNLDDNFVRICPTNYNQAEALNLLLSSHNKQKLMIIYDEKNSAYSRDLSEFIRKDFDSSNREAKSISYSNVNREFVDRVIYELNRNKYDSVLFIAGAHDVAVLSQELLKNNIVIDLYSGNWALTRELITNGGKSVEGLYIVHEKSREIELNNYTLFKKRYIELYGDIPSQIGSRAYEAVRLLTWGIENSKSKTPEDVKNTIIQKGNISGILQSYDINKYGDTSIPHNIYRIKDGEFIEEF